MTVEEEAKSSPPREVMTEKSMDEKVVYDGLVLTSIDVVPDPDNPKRVTFNDNTIGCVDDRESVFLCNVTEISRKGKGWAVEVEFEADLLTTEEVVARLKLKASDQHKKALFVIHGFNTNASYHLLDCKMAKPKFTKTHIVPVIWPSQGKGGLFDYFDDKKYSKAAGQALQSMKEPLKDLRNAGVRSSIVCHSMGNRVFRNFAHPSMNFDNIFMVAPDVPTELFSEKYINGKPIRFLGLQFGDDEEMREHALNIKGMLTDDKEGKIHVLFNGKDVRMGQSTIMNMGDRLGGTGIIIKDAPNELQSCVMTVNASIKEDSHERMLYDDEGDHNYHFYVETVKFYEENA